MPKRHGDLYDKMLTLDALHAAYLRGRRGKRRTRSVAEFEANLGSELLQLQQELVVSTYRPRPYRKFWINETGKPRLIAAPAFRDVVVQHALYGLVYPIFDKTFCFDSYGCRKGKGTHRAADRAQQFLRESPDGTAFLQMDIRKFYYRIDRARLRRLIEQKIKDRRIIELMMVVRGLGGASRSSHWKLAFTAARAHLLKSAGSVHQARAKVRKIRSVRR